MAKGPIEKVLQAVIELEKSISDAEKRVEEVQKELIRRADAASAELSQEAARHITEVAKELEDLYRAEALKVEEDAKRRLALVEEDLRKRASQNFDRAVSSVVDAIKRLASGE